jgi:[protein-PII] uridylyltransferase
MPPQPSLPSAADLLATLTPLAGAAPIAEACRQVLAEHETALRRWHDEGADGLANAEARATLLDAVVGAMFTKLAGAAADASVVAVGAYGRGTLNPQTSPRFLVLAASPEAAADLSELTAAFELLELPPCHPVADPAACAAAAREDFGFAKSLLDARLVAGSEALFGQLTAAASRLWTGAATEKFLARCLLEFHSRHQQHSGTVFLQEPNVWKTCGGLEDYHAMRRCITLRQGTPDFTGPFAAALLTAQARGKIRAAVSFLHRVRNELHYHTQAPTDSLTLLLQGVVADAFGYSQGDVLRRTEALMRDYYRHTRSLHQLAVDLTLKCAASPEPPAKPVPDGEFDRFDGFIIRGDTLEPGRNDPFASDPGRLMRAFLHCQLRRLTPGPQLSALIAAALPRIDDAFREAESTREVFQTILEHKGEVASTLRLMHRHGVLGRLLPEFGALEALVQHEFFHRYTADEHTLRCLDELDRLAEENRRERAIFRHLLHEVADPYALYLAVLLHDSGRADNVDEHTTGSTAHAIRLCERLKIHGPRRSLILFLVENHLAFWRTATTRNLEEPEVIEEFAAIVRTQANLDALLLFTFADTNGTSPDAWNGWKESLMLQLYNATRRFLDGGGRAAYDRQLAADREELRHDVDALLGDDYRADIASHFELMPTAAFSYREDSHIATQIRTVREFLRSERTDATGSPYAIEWLDYPARGYTEMFLVTRDRPALLEHLCCALAACQINVLAADFFTRADHLVVDVFRVCTCEFEPAADPALREMLLDCFQIICDDPNHDASRYLHHLAPDPAGIPLLARVCNDLHPTCTAIEIQAPDRLGLLHDLFQTINRHGLTTAHARICTEKGVAMDTLYITTPEGGKVTDDALLESLRGQLSALVATPETTP